MLIKRPALYERTKELFWNDPYIAEQMLKAHLDPNTDAASRKPEFIRRCADWTASLPLPENTRLLDIGCGPGLYAKQFTQRGLRVTGMDFSEGSIVYAKEHDPRSEYVLGNYLAMEYDSAFDAVTLIYCDYGALIPGEREELLRRVRRALRPGGLFLFDVNTPRHLDARRPKKAIGVNRKGGFWSPHAHICLHAGYLYGESVAADRYAVLDRRGLRRYNLWETCFTRQSLLEEAAPAGFTPVDFYSDMTGAPYADTSETLCAVLRKE